MFAVQIFTSQAVVCKMRAAADAAQRLVFRDLMQILFYYWQLENYFQSYTLKCTLSNTSVLFRACFSVHWIGSSVEPGSRKVNILS